MKKIFDRKGVDFSNNYSTFHLTLKISPFKGFWGFGV